MIFVSKDARALVQRLGWMSDEEHLRAEELTLKFPLGVLQLGRSFPPDAPPTMPDCPLVDFRPYAEAYLYVCKDFVTADYGRIDALRLAYLASHYPLPAIRRVAERCKHLGHFTIAYLAAAMESEGAAEIDALRRENKLDELISATEPLQLPPKRFPGKLTEGITMADIDREIDSMRKKGPHI